LRRNLVDRYEIVRELGRGGTAYVYLAEDKQRHQLVALKALRPELGASLGSTRFLREVEIVRRLDHPNILALFESGVAGGDLYYTMPFVVGSTLRARLREQGQLAIDTAIAIARQVGVALEHAHHVGIIHRDITPANILLEGDSARVADFGIARAMSVASGDHITDSGLALGTPEYVSPEQGSGDRQVDGRTDLYALGCVLYEMLAGEPPFTGPTAQAIIARHCHEAPRSLRIIRPAIPPGLERVILKALAKVPADRYASAGAFIQALDGVDLDEVPTIGGWRGRRRWLYAGLTVATGVIAAASWQLTRQPANPLDPRRIVVFPPSDQSRAAANDPSSEGVATYIGYALEGTRPLKWLEGSELMRAQRSPVSDASPVDSRRVSAQAGAAYYIDGAILRRPDSVTVVLRLHAVAGDSVVKRAGATGIASAYLPHLALRAVAELLPVILEPGRTIDLRALSERPTAAVANFLQGEHEYRRMQFPAALEHYGAAIREDSAFGIAAFRAAQTSNWLSQPDTTLIDLALREQGHLSPAQLLLAKGLHSYLTGNADSAVDYLSRAVRADSSQAAAWTLLGEVYARSLTSAVPADSLARASLRRARQLDADFAPTLVLLEEMALLDGNIQEVERLRDALRRAGADTTHAVERDLMLRCVRDGRRAVNWAAEARRDPGAMIIAGRILARGLAQPTCAHAAFLAVLQDDSSSRGRRWGALVGLHGMLIGLGKPDEVSALLASKAAATLPAWTLTLAAASVGLGFDRKARAATDSIGRKFGAMRSTDLWSLGAWAARANDQTTLAEIAQTLRKRADSTRQRQDVLLFRLIDARLPLAAGDTAGAIERLRALRPTAERLVIGWQHAEVLGSERLLLAELLLSQKAFREAIRVASELDATEPVPYLLYLRPSVSIRERAASLTGDGALAEYYRNRLRRLDRAQLMASAMR
jgi:tRNA A-37 threonylcarbamoyl transferase component Bud32/tetratricopeptide (TPR) repeat protein